MKGFTSLNQTDLFADLRKTPDAGKLLKASLSVAGNSFRTASYLTRDHRFRDCEHKLGPDQLRKPKKQTPHPLIPVHVNNTERVSEELYNDELQM